jgi:hypothetical protein
MHIMGTNLNPFATRPQAPQAGAPAQTYTGNSGAGNTAQRSSQRGRNWVSNEDFVPSDTYLNPGMRVPCVDAAGNFILNEQGEMTFKDIFLTRGIGLDNAEPYDTTSSNAESDWPVRAAEMNALMALFKACASLLEPGEGMTIALEHYTPLLEVRRRKDRDQNVAPSSEASNSMTLAAKHIAAMKTAKAQQGKAA